MAKFSKPADTLFTQISSGIYKGKRLALPALSSTRSTKSIVKGSFFDTWRVELRGAAFIECFGGSGAMALEALSNGAKNVYAIEKDAAAHKIMRKNFELFGLGANAILGDCFERLPEILHELQANMNGRSGANSPNLSGKNLGKNRATACYENLDVSCGENLHSSVNLTRGSRKNFAANSHENFACSLGESAAANDLGECSVANSSKSHTVNSSENFVSDPARRVFVYLDPPFAIRQGFGGIYERVLALIARLGSVQCELLIAIEHMSELELPPKIGDFVLLKSRKFGATTMSYYAK